MTEDRRAIGDVILHNAKQSEDGLGQYYYGNYAELMSRPGTLGQEDCSVCTHAQGHTHSRRDRIGSSRRLQQSSAETPGRHSIDDHVP
jgi:hypothetical protein